MGHEGYRDEGAARNTKGNARIAIRARRRREQHEPKGGAGNESRV